MKSNNSYKKLFESLPQNEPARDIMTLVMDKIHKRRIIYTRLGVTVYTTMFISALFSCIPATQNLISSASQSGFIQYASLSISDSSTVLSSWKTFSLSILESMPILEISILVGLLLLSAYSLRMSASYFSKINFKTYKSIKYITT